MLGAPDERALLGAFFAASGSRFFGASGWQYEQADRLIRVMSVIAFPSVYISYFE
jgi:hypothetical protein